MEVDGCVDVVRRTGHQACSELAVSQAQGDTSAGWWAGNGVIGARLSSHNEAQRRVQSGRGGTMQSQFGGMHQKLRGREVDGRYEACNMGRNGAEQEGRRQQANQVLFGRASAASGKARFPRILPRKGQRTARGKDNRTVGQLMSPNVASNKSKKR